MCGRFTLRASPQEVVRHFRLLEMPQFQPRYNIAPGQLVGIVRAEAASRRDQPQSAEQSFSDRTSNSSKPVIVLGENSTPGEPRPRKTGTLKMDAAGTGAPNMGATGAVAPETETPKTDTWATPRGDEAGENPVSEDPMEDGDNTSPGQLRHWAWVRWGLVPHWAEDPAIGNRLINARAETITSKPAFRSAARYRRCLLPADGFYEWRNTAKGKQPFFIRLQGDRIFALAGLWECWESPAGEILETCTILTTEPNPLLAKLHNRMPVILPPEAYQDWLDPAITDVSALKQWLQPYPAEEMEILPVSFYVNSAHNEGPRCIEPLAEA